MSLLGEQIDRTLATIEARVGNRVIVWRGVEVPCIPQSATNAYQIKPGGLEENPGVVIMIRWALWRATDSSLISVDSDMYTMDQDFGKRRSADLGDMKADTESESGDSNAMDRRRYPIAGKFLTYNGKRYRIDSARMDAMQSFVRMELGDVNR